MSRRNKRIQSPAAGLVMCILFNQSLSPAVAQKKRVAPRQAPTAAQILEAKQRLDQLGYWVNRIDDKFDAAAKHTLVAFQKAGRREITGRLTEEELEAIRGASAVVPRERGEPHVEVDLSRQILFMVDAEGRVSRILPISSGNNKPFTSEGWTRNAVTPTGRFKVFRKIAGWRKSPLGLLHYPSYIVGGIAIHGNPLVPTYAASHGCIRIPMFASKEFSDLTPIGTPVLVYDDDTVLTPAPVPQ